MKVLYLITKSNWGGAQRNVYDLATSLKNRGHDIAVALGGDGLLRTRLEAAGIFTHSISGLGRDISAGKDAGSFKEIFSLIRHRKPDVLHVHSSKAGGLGALAGRLLGVKHIVFTAHGWAFNEDWRPLWSRAMIAFFSWLTMILCHKVIVISEREYAQALHFPFVAKKLALIHLGISKPTFISVDGAKQTLAKMTDLSVTEFNKKIAIITIAELHINKGLTFLANAMTHIVSLHPEALWIVMGDGEEKSALHLIIKGNKLERNISLVGNIEHAAEYLKGAHIFALPSVKEGLPYTLLEAGTAGLPVVSTTVGGIPELVEDMRSGILVQPRNPKELAHAISFLIEHPEERRRYGAALKEKISRDFSISKMVEETERCYTAK